MTVESTNEYQLPSTPKDRKAIRGAAEEIIVQLIHKASADDHIKAICERMKEELEVPPKFLKKLATTEFKNHDKDNDLLFIKSDRIVPARDLYDYLPDKTKEIHINCTGKILFVEKSDQLYARVMEMKRVTNLLHTNDYIDPNDKSIVTGKQIGRAHV